MGAELRQEALLVGRTDPGEQADMERRAAVHVADQVGKENPHELDNEDPQQAGRELAKNPVIAAGLLELIDALGLRRGLSEIELLQTREVELEAELATATDVNQQLKGGAS